MPFRFEFIGLYHFYRSQSSIQSKYIINHNNIDSMRKLFFIMMAVLACSFSALAQTKTFHGTVVDAANDEPLIGATVAAVGSTQAVATDLDGNFKITVPNNVKQVKVSYVGYNPMVVALKEGMTIMLQSSTQNLDDLVVVAYGTQKKSSITGAISQIDAEEIAKRPVSSATAALEGYTPGITVTANYGSPGESPTILIRGIGTVNGSTQPLYVVDGVPFGGNITDISPDDIESMSVLKDAASAALYGNRASNGVILITTKKAKSERLTLNFRTAQGWYERAIPEYERTNAAQYMHAEYMNMANAYLQNNPTVERTDKESIHEYVTDNIIGQRLYANYFTERNVSKLFTQDGYIANGVSLLPEVAEDVNWFDQATRHGYRQEYVLNGAGSTNRSDYSFSVSYLGEEGYMKDSNFDRLTGRAAVNINPVNWLRAGLNIGVSHQKYQNTSNGVGDGSTSYNNPFYFCRYMAPIYPVHQHYVENTTYYDEDGNPYTVNAGQYVLDASGQRIYDDGNYEVYNEKGNLVQVDTRNQNTDRNVILESMLNRSITKRNTMNAIGYVDFLLPYGFTVSLKGNLNTRNSENFAYGSKEIGDSKARGGSLKKIIYNYKNWNMQQQINWNKTYGDHNIQVLLGHENYSWSRDYTYIVKDNEAFPNVYALSNFSVMNSIEGYKTQYRTESYLGRVMWNYNNTYNLEASVRRDGTSRFAKKTRWGTFGSVGANWIFTNEEFMKPTATWLNNAKLRADWGQVGNDEGSDYYAYYALFNSDTNASLPAYYLSQNAAEDLKWETSESWGVALEARMFNRWNLTLEYFDKRNKDLIFDVYAPVSAGPTSTDYAISTITQNLGTISNRGIEISTDVDIIRTKDWKFNVGANMTWIQNKIVTLPAQNNIYTKLAADPSMQPPRGISDGSRFIAEGKSRYEWYTYHWAGVDMLDGQSLYDANLVDYHITKDDGTIIGGSYECNEDGSPVIVNGKKVLISTELENYKEINGKYYVGQTTYAAKGWRGSSLPNVYGSFNGNLSWKGFQLSAMFTYSLGGKIYESNYYYLMSPGEKPQNYHVDILNSWNGAPAGMTEDSADRINPNINPEINYLTSADNNTTSDRWLTSRDYLCFKNLNLTYTLPTQLTKHWGIQRIQVSFSAENLHIWGSRKGMNPMMSISGGQSNYLVPARVYTFGLNFNL